MLRRGLDERNRTICVTIRFLVRHLRNVSVQSSG